MEFHVSREARDRYEFDQTLFAFSGNVVFANLGASREFAFRMNKLRNAEKDPTQTINPGALYAMGLIDEMSHALVDYYRQRLDPKVMADALGWFDGRIGKEELDKTILAFVEQFPTAGRLPRGTDAGRMAGRPNGRHLPSGSGLRGDDAAVAGQRQPCLQTLLRAVYRSVPHRSDPLPADHRGAA